MKQMKYSDLEKLFKILQSEGKADGMQLSDFSEKNGDENDQLLSKISQIAVRVSAAKQMTN
jgi:hypothetical protein